MPREVFSRNIPWFILKDSVNFGRFSAMKISGLNNYVLSVARALYVFVTVAAVCGALALLNIGGH